MRATSTPETAVTVTVVHSPACHLCDDARAVLDELAATYPLEIELVGAEETRGRGLIAEHRAAMYPLVLLDGQYFSAGRLPRKKLRHLLEHRAAAAVA
jgi:hypothetical protein